MIRTATITEKHKYTLTLPIHSSLFFDIPFMRSRLTLMNRPLQTVDNVQQIETMGKEV
jgi:hypothetical protein